MNGIKRGDRVRVPEDTLVSQRKNWKTFRMTRTRVVRIVAIRGEQVIWRRAGRTESCEVSEVQPLTGLQQLAEVAP